MTRPAAGRGQRRGVARALGGEQRTGRSPGGSSDAIDPVDEPAVTDPWYRHLLWPVLGAVGCAVGMIAAGVPAWRAVVIGLSAAVALWAVILSLHAEEPEWPYDLPSETHRAPTTWQVPGLIGAQESAHSFDTYLRPRLWGLAQQLLQRRGIDPSSPAAVGLIGPREYALLTGTERDPGRVTSSISVLCQTIARLAVEPDPGGEPAIRNPALAGLAGRTRRPPGRRKPVELLRNPTGKKRHPAPAHEGSRQ